MARSDGRSCGAPDDPGFVDRMERLARRVERLTVCRRDPEAFFEERSEIAAAIMREAIKRAS